MQRLIIVSNLLSSSSTLPPGQYRCHPLTRARTTKPNRRKISFYWSKKILWIILLAYFPLYDCYYFIGCSGYVLIGPPRLMHFAWSGSRRFVVRSRLLILIVWLNSRYDPLSLHIRTLAVDLRNFQLAAGGQCNNVVLVWPCHLYLSAVWHDRIGSMPLY